MSKLERWLTLVANLSVVAGIVFLAIQMQQNTNMMRAQTRGEITQSMLNTIELARDPRFVSATLKRDTGEPLTEEDRYIIQNMANASLRLGENNQYQYENGLFDQDEFEAARAAQVVLMQDPVRRELWEQTRETYSPSFRAEIDRIVAEVEQGQ